MRKPLSIVQVNTYERRGGAASVAWHLHEAYREAGHRALLVVGRGEVSDEGAVPILDGGRPRVAHLLAGPGRLLDRYRGRETFRYPATRGLLDGLPEPPDILHLHNLHGGYFDLRLLPELSRRTPVVLTLHDAWLLSGHCSHSLGCERWRTGCGACPDLSIYPEIRRDVTAANWKQKREIFRRSRLHVAVPSEWLAEKVRASMLAEAVEELRVIPNGVDLGLFAPDDPAEARKSLGLPIRGPLLLTTGERLRTNPFKDFDTVRRAAAAAADTLGEDLTLVVLGDEGPEEEAGGVHIRFVPFQPDPALTALYYTAADLYLHAAHADTFPLSVLEALACGTPVVATAVGGIPEQIVSLPREGNSWAARANGATGLLVGPGEAGPMGRAAAHLLARPGLAEQLGSNARTVAEVRFGIERQAERYLYWYDEIMIRRPEPALSDA